MKTNKLIISVLIIFFFISTSCSDFNDANIDPINPTKVDPNSQLSYVQLYTFGHLGLAEGTANYPSTFVQHLMGNWSMTYYGGQYRKHDDSFGLIWNSMYGTPIKNIVDIARITDNDPNYASLNAMIRVYKVYLFSILTDVFGDIPYSDAGKGYSDRNFKPNFDKQEDIYTDFFNELDIALEKLKSSNGNVTGDMIYNGDVSKWKMFLNSLRLRLAMRIADKNNPKAHDELKKALDPSNGGIILTSDNDAIIKYLDIFDWDFNEIRRNGLSQTWRGRDAVPTPFLCSTLWEYLKNTKDPRQFIIGRAYYENSGNQSVFDRIDLTDEIKEQSTDLFQPIKPGYFQWDNWPSGYMSTLANGYVDKWTRPQLNKEFLRGNTPGIIITSAEINLLLSEATLRWNDLGVAESSEQYYATGVRQAMTFLSEKYGLPLISTSNYEKYMEDNPYPTDTENRKKMINEQLWLLHLTNPIEAYNNWRRSGYPTLLPSSYYKVKTIDSQSIPRRLCYPLFEKTYNPEGYEQAISRIDGTDNWNKGVWWDVKY